MNVSSNDIGNYLATLKVGTKNVVKGDILNEKFLKLNSPFLRKFGFQKLFKNDKKYFLFQFK